MDGETVRANRRIQDVTRITTKMLLPVREMEFVTEASTLGWKPGQWPTEITVETEAGDTAVFSRWASPMKNPDGEMTGYIYQAMKDATGKFPSIIVYND
jgi:hypothetical protein